MIRTPVHVPCWERVADMEGKNIAWSFPILNCRVTIWLCPLSCSCLAREQANVLFLCCSPPASTCYKFWDSFPSITVAKIFFWSFISDYSHQNGLKLLPACAWFLCIALLKHNCLTGLLLKWAGVSIKVVDEFALYYSNCCLRWLYSLLWVFTHALQLQAFFKKPNVK